MRVTKQKATGAHFTPPALARILAERIVGLMDAPSRPIRILDPACGNGSLLSAIAEAIPKGILQWVTLIGIEKDEALFASLCGRRAEFGACHTDLIKGDFLDLLEGSLLDSPGKIEPVDIVIANPPYVRTQVLGANRAQQLASWFALSGRIDLYQVFLVGMAKLLRPGGILGVIISNRFLTTRAGMATRRFLRTNFDLIEIVDLGDTKLFEAAVLPALVFGRKRGLTEVSPVGGPSFVRIYEVCSSEAPKAEKATSILDYLSNPTSGFVSVNGTTYRITAGPLALSNDDTKPWSLLTSSEHQWVRRIDSACWRRIGDVAKVRVGIKTTADDVFIRRDWDSLPSEIRPEPEYLRPLLSQEDAARWLPRVTERPQKYVLYPYEVVNGRRRVIEFDKRSPTWQYLLKNRKRLESRKYVLEAGRSWYEIWVPQDPCDWPLPKIVFPDISQEPRFFLDTRGCIVDGNCYWITTNDPADENLLLLILGVANSAVLARYHDLVFQNRLYAHRKRHLTQYVAEYPLPEPDTPTTQEIVKLVHRLVNERLSNEEQQFLELEVDRLVRQAFGVGGSEFKGIGD